MSLYSDLNEVLTPYAQRIKGLATANDEIKADLGGVTDVVFDDLSEVSTPSFVTGKAISYSNGNIVTDATFSASDYTATHGFKILEVTMPILNTNITRGVAVYDSNKTFIRGVKCIYDATLSALGVKKYYISCEGASYYRTTWFASTEETFSARLINAMPNANDCLSSNLLDVSKLTIGKRTATNGNINNASTLCFSNLIPVKSGDVIVGSMYYNYEPHTFSYVTAYDKYKNPMINSGAENVTSYTVPDGVAFIVVTAAATWINAPYARINKNGVIGKYQPYKQGSANAFSADNHMDVSNILRYPLTTLPDYILKNIAYKNLGALEKGYVCFVCDDGRNELATYTLPTVIEKGIPITMAVMQESEVFSNIEYTQAVVDAVNNHRCVIAQHGLVNWDNYDEFALESFFNTQASYWSTLGLTPYGAVCPSHRINDMIRAVAGGRFGCLRSGFAGSDGNVLYYDNYMNGPRSNINGLSCYSINDGTLATQKQWIDMAIAKHYLCIIFWHDVDFASDMELRAKFEAILDYAKASDAEIITMKDIPTII